MGNRDVNRWKGFVLGAGGGVAGILAMRYYWKAVTAITGGDPRKASGPAAKHPPQPLDHVSLIGKHHQQGESSTAAAGRILYTALTGKPPQSAETKTVLSYVVDWVISLGAAGAYGAWRGSARFPDVPGGLVLGVGLWLGGDEAVMPLTGLTAGPTAYTPALHAHALGAHLAYGLASSAAAQALQAVTDAAG
jgi:hypothetical protein